jgi:hypothetical protein
MPLQALIFSGTRSAKLRSFPLICGAAACPVSVSKMTREALAISSSRRCLSLPIAASPFAFFKLFYLVFKTMLNGLEMFVKCFSTMHLAFLTCT